MALPGWGCFGQVDQFLFCCAKSLHVAGMRRKCFGPDKLYNVSQAEHCCDGDYSQKLFDALAPGITGGNLRAWELDMALHLLESYLMGHDHMRENIWELLAQALTVRGMIAYNEEIAAATRFTNELGTEAEKEVADAVSRRLHRAHQVIEALHHVVLQQVAWKTDRAPFSVHPSEPEVQKIFWPIGVLYSEVSVALDRLAFYQPVRGRGSLKFGSGERLPGASLGDDICIAVAVVGRWARKGLVTVWSLLRQRSEDGRALRIFVLGDPVGLIDWDEAVAEALAGAEQSGEIQVAERLRQARVEQINISASPFFQRYLGRLPESCVRGSGFRPELFARMICHELLPAEVRRCLVIDIGDVLLFDDVAGLWDFGEEFGANDVLAAGWHYSKIRKPSEMNGGVVLYDLQRMRAWNWTEDTLAAAELALARHGPEACEWDQDIINVLRDYVYRGDASRPQVAKLPCRWSLIPSMEWKVGWNSPGRVQPAMWEQKRYPGILSADRVEVYCPSSVELLQMAYASITPEVQRLQLASIELEGTDLRPEYPQGTRARFSGPGCTCGEKVALLHVPGTMKRWPWLRRLFLVHRPAGLRDLEEDEEGREESEDPPGWSDADMEGILSTTMIMARSEGKVASFKNCATMPTPADQLYRQVVWEKGLHRPGSDSSPLIVAIDAGRPEAGARVALGATMAGNEFQGLDLEMGRHRWRLRWNPWGPVLAESKVLQDLSVGIAWVSLDSQRGMLAAGLLVRREEEPLLTFSLSEKASRFLQSMGTRLGVWLSSGAGWGPGGHEEAQGAPPVSWLVCSCALAPEAQQAQPQLPSAKAPSWQLCPDSKDQYVPPEEL
eukprot:TRINITY_DN35548_c0_g1_i1.p1 TRINITY_DN35548_c0_g1~~TRINITY_DN35548_c0_g1_i1.p1  ORF type:complete len:840 (-),score=167.27 TRINITY_DN35548_c0_g1_i1:29-2548(-)